MRSILLSMLFLIVAGGSSTVAATLPTGFSETQLASGIDPSAMEFAPDGRLFVCEKNGKLRVIKDGKLLTAPFVTVDADDNNERGLLGVTFDPAFSTNHFVYVYYTAKNPTHNRISRFVADGDVAAGAENILFDLDPLNAGNHNGGAIHFGKDGKLYVAVGNNAVSPNSQSLANVLGKMLRLNADGTIPWDNPFVASTTGKNQAIWALGLRNPFTSAINAAGRIFINDVGESNVEEIDDGVANSNYGWPGTEGNTGTPPSSPGTYRAPIYTYTHGGGNCAITGGAFYITPATSFPSSYAGTYFFADYCGGWIKNLDPANGNAVKDFASGIKRPIDVKTGPDGYLYYMARGNRAVGVSQGSVADNTSTADGGIFQIKGATTGLERLNPGSGRRAFVATIGFSNTRVTLPAGFRGIEVWDLSGKIVWSYSRSASIGEMSVELPASMGEATYQVRYLP